MVFDNLRASQSMYSAPNGLSARQTEDRRMRKHTPKSVKSVTITTNVRIQATAATKADKMDPPTPAPMPSRKAMNASTKQIGCRIITCVSVYVVEREASLKV